MEVDEYGSNTGGGAWHLWCLHRNGYFDCLTAGALRATHSPEGPSTWLIVTVILGLVDICLP